MVTATQIRRSFQEGTWDPTQTEQIRQLREIYHQTPEPQQQQQQPPPPSLVGEERKQQQPQQQQVPLQGVDTTKQLHHESSLPPISTSPEHSNHPRQRSRLQNGGTTPGHTPHNHTLHHHHQPSPHNHNNDTNRRGTTINPLPALFPPVQAPQPLYIPVLIVMEAAEDTHRNTTTPTKALLTPSSSTTITATTNSARQGGGGEESIASSQPTPMPSQHEELDLLTTTTTNRDDVWSFVNKDAASTSQWSAITTATQGLTLAIGQVRALKNRFNEEFDRDLFCRMDHPLSSREPNMSTTLEVIWQIQKSLKELQRYLKERGNPQLWDYVPCNDPTSVSVERVFTWLQSLRQPREIKPQVEEVKPKYSGQKELGRFVRNITPEMIHRIVRYVDEDRNGTIDIAELDKAFRLSRWQIDEAIEVPETSDDERSQEGSRSRLNTSSSFTDLSISGGKPPPSPFSSSWSNKPSTAGSSASGISAGTAISTTSTVSTAYSFFLEMDLRNMLTYLQYDHYGMIDLSKTNKLLRQLGKIEIKNPSQDAVISTYFEYLAEQLSNKGMTPQVWARVTFGESLLMVDMVEFRRGVETLLESGQPSSFFGPNFTVLETTLQEETGKKGYVSIMLLIGQLERAHSRLKPAISRANHRRSSNIDLMLFRNSIERMESFVYGRYSLHLGEYLRSLDQERTGRVSITKIRDALTLAAKQPAPDQVVRMLLAEKQEKIRKQERERQKKQRVFLNRLIRMQNQGVTDVLRKFEKFMRERGMRLQDFFNLVDEDHSGSITQEELVQALFLFAHRPENPIRTMERIKRNESTQRRTQEREAFEEAHSAFIKRCREVEEMGAHNALMKIAKHLRRRQTTIFHMFPGEPDQIRSVSKDELHFEFSPVHLSMAEIDRLFDYMRGWLTTQSIQKTITDYAKYKRLTKKGVQACSNEAEVPLFVHESIMNLIRFFYWHDKVDEDADLRISLNEMQTAVDNCRKKHILSYAKDYRHKLFCTTTTTTNTRPSSKDATNRPSSSSAVSKPKIAGSSGSKVVRIQVPPVLASK